MPAQAAEGSTLPIGATRPDHRADRSPERCPARRALAAILPLPWMPGWRGVHGQIVDLIGWVALADRLGGQKRTPRLIP